MQSSVNETIDSGTLLQSLIQEALRLDSPCPTDSLEVEGSVSPHVAMNDDRVSNVVVLVDRENSKKELRVDTNLNETKDKGIDESESSTESKERIELAAREVASVVLGREVSTEEMISVIMKAIDAGENEDVSQDAFKKVKR